MNGQKGVCRGAFTISPTSLHFFSRFGVVAKSYALTGFVTAREEVGKVKTVPK